jgi:hypothetical protein
MDERVLIHADNYWVWRAHLRAPEPEPARAINLLAARAARHSKFYIPVRRIGDAYAVTVADP